MDLVSGAALAKQALDNVHSIVQLTQKFGDVELKRRIVDLEDQVSELARERRILAEDNEELKKALRIRRSPRTVEIGGIARTATSFSMTREFHPTRVRSVSPWRSGTTLCITVCG